MKKVGLLFRCIMITVAVSLVSSIGWLEQTGADKGDKGKKMMKNDDFTFFEMPDVLPEPLRSEVLSTRAGEMVIAAPTAVDLQKNKKIPLLLTAADTKLQSKLVSSALNTAVLTIDLNSGALQTANAFPMDPTKTYPPAPPRQKEKFYPQSVQDVPTSNLGPNFPPPPPRPPASIAQLWLDLKKLRGLAWNPSRYTVRVLMYDRISNPVQMEIVIPDNKPKKPGFPADVAHEIEMEARRAHAVPNGIKSFLEGPKTPKLQTENLKITISHQVKTKEAIELFGAAKLNLGSEMIVDSRNFAGEMQNISPNDLPGAVIPVFILICELDRPTPIQIQVSVPYPGKNLKSGEEAIISFSLNLDQELRPSLQEGTYFVYAIVGQYASGPHRLDIKND